MAAPKTGEKLAGNQMDKTVHIRMDEGTVRRLDFCCEKLGMNRSVVIRKGIYEQYERLKKKK